MNNLKEELLLSVDHLTWNPTEEGILDRTTSSIEPQEDTIGQDRAVKAIRRGLAMKNHSYNIYVAGYNGTGRTATVKKLLDEFNVSGPIPDDLCYVNNFKNADQPRLIALKAGKGREFKQRMNDLVNMLKKKIPAIFESEEFQAARNEIVNRHMGAQKALFKNFENKVSSESFMMVQVQVGPFTRPDLAPVVVGNPMKIEQLEQLVEEGKFSPDELAKIKTKYKELTGEMEKIFKAARDIEKTIQEDLEKLAKDWIHPLLKDMLNPIRDEFDTEAVRAYLEEIETDTVSNLDRFRPKLVAPQAPGGEPAGPPMLVPPDPTQFRDYDVNLLVDNSETTKPPVVIETTPMFRNLFGTVERTMDRHGLWFSDYLQIKAGSFLQANGGYLILNARDALLEAGVWPTLKRSLRTRVMEIQTDPYSFFFTSALKPEKIPISLKVIMIGEPEIYDLLHWYEEDFRKVFKIKADFDTSMPNTSSNLQKVVGFISRICEQESLLPCDPSGLLAVAKLAIRWGGRKKKLTAQFERVSDLLREADFNARESSSEYINGEHVEKANRDRIERLNMIEDKIHEYIEDGILMIDTDGAQIGQINGLSVYSFPEFSFGRPSRITVKTSMGKSGIINIEREAELSGNSYNKGVLILAGFLRWRFAQDKPLNLTASITFEQSYSGVDGDSASSTELYALMSALSGAPIDQGIAVTGSVNQHGEIQPIGGVNYKIEGFFKVCKTMGLTGKQGVIVPRRNVGDIMLDSEVLEEVAKNNFHIWAVDHVDQGIEILTGVPAGKADEEGLFPEGTINYLVNKRLEELSEGLKEFESSGEEETKDSEKEESADPALEKDESVPKG
ncbi:MAG: AAA family ATPase [Desulfomonile tiedjei]|uniref:endopeptidase La n=1 Tax=Desulfomonile tiedjei TaxID=2358 RepID=A0A9D6Z2W5_9BACT|nr:AAA family ATPase [Desulfomonile tiedjei]